jgi:hypothetical protein
MDKKSDADIRRGECGVTQGHLRSLRPNLRSSGRAFRISTLGFAAGIHGCQQCVAGNPGGLFRAGKRQDILLGALAVTMQVQQQIFCLNGNLEKIAQFQAVTGAWRIHALRKRRKGRRFDRPDLTACSATLKRSATGRNGEGRFVGEGQANGMLQDTGDR